MATAKPKKKNPRLASGRKRVRQDVVSASVVQGNFVRSNLRIES